MADRKVPILNRRAVVTGSGAAAIAAGVPKNTDGSDFSQPQVVRPALGAASDAVGVLAVGVVQDGSTQTAAIQANINALAGRRYAKLFIPYDVKFDSTDLDFTVNHNITIQHFADDDIGVGTATQLATGELQELVVHSSYDAIGNPGGAYVAQRGLLAPVHAAVGADTRYNLLGTNSPEAGMAPDQDLFDPVRASLYLDLGGRGFHHITARFFTSERSRFNAVSYKTFYDTYTLTGVGTSAWATPPAVGDRVTTSGGFAGFVRAIDATTMTVQVALAFRPEIGQTMSDANESGKGPISAVNFNGYQEFSPLGQSTWHGRWSINVAAQDAESVWTVGGDIRVRQPEDNGQIYDDVEWPGYVWEHSSGPTVGASARQVEGESPSRVYLYDGPTEAASPRGMVGAVCASTAFNHTDLVPQLSAINVTSVTNPGTGQYRVTMTRSMANIRYTVSLALNKGLARASAGTFYTVEYEIVSSSIVDVFVYLVDLAANTITAANLPGSVYISLAVLNGDI